MSQRRISFATVIVAALSTIGVHATCSGDQKPLCCFNVAPWSTNSGVWGGICGYTPPSPNQLVGARCIPYNPQAGW